MDARPSQTIVSFQIAIALLLTATPAAWAAEDKPINLAAGPQLFIDDYLVARSKGVERKVNMPQRFLKEPVVTGKIEHQNFQPFLSVIHDPALPTEKQFRMWYNVDVFDDYADGAFAGHTGLLESADGVNWPGPYKRLTSLVTDGRVRFNASVLDEGPHHAPPAERYKMLYFDAGGELLGPKVAFSADGAEWAIQNGGKSILPKSPGDDIWTAGYDPIRKRYFLIGKQFSPYEWTNADGKKLNVAIRRYFTSFSNDFKTWSDPSGFVFSPDSKDTGITQWYGAAGFMTRGDLIFGFLRVLHDERSPEGVPPEAIAANTRGHAGLGASGLGKDGGSGMGYTVLCWTRDGVTWQRDRHTDPYFEPDPTVGAWDHAMAWVGTAAPVGDEVYLYYAGYKWGHKYHHSTERQFGLVKAKRDRFVARRAGEKGGTLVTPAVTLPGGKLTLNVAMALGGEVRVQATDLSGKPLDGLSFDDCVPVTGDALAAPVTFKSKSIDAVRNTPLRLEFRIKNASLYALELGNL